MHERNRTMIGLRTGPGIETPQYVFNVLWLAGEKMPLRCGIETPGIRGQDCRGIMLGVDGNGNHQHLFSLSTHQILDLFETG